MALHLIGVVIKTNMVIGKSLTIDELLESEKYSAVLLVAAQDFRPLWVFWWRT